MSRDYSDLQVVPDRSYPEVVQFDKDPANKIIAEQPQATPRRRICGLPPKWFWIALIAVVLITGAVVGGAVGGTQANKSSNDTPSDSASTEPDQATTGSDKSTSEASKASPTTASFSTRTLIGPTQTLYRDCPSADDTIYEALGSSDYKFRKRCNVGITGSPNNVVNIPATSLDDCIDKCASYNEKNKTEIASRQSSICNSVCWRHRVKNDDLPGQCFGTTIQNSTSSGFPVDEDQIECDSGAWINQEIPSRDG
ncbi:hypothetical protein ACHAPT_009007 [Fusarium lateritium]